MGDFDWIYIESDEENVKKERKKASELKKSSWWKNKLAASLCHYCNQRFSPKELTMDHIVPLSRGGKSTKGNVVPACKKCNTDKKWLTPVEEILKKANKD